MKSPRTRYRGCLLFVGLSGGHLMMAWSTLPAQSVAMAPKPVKTPVFLDPSQIRLQAVLPAPAANDAPRTRAELAELHAIEARRTPAEVAAARFDEAHEDMFLYGNVLGGEFVAEKLPRTMELSLHLRNDAGLVNSQLKKAFGRPRPYNLDKTLHPVCETNQEGSYPSGHAVNGYLYSYVLEMMVPERAAEIRERADAYAHSRMVCEAHYASDLEASRREAYIVFGAMLETPRFQKEYAAARGETRAAIRLPVNDQ